MRARLTELVVAVRCDVPGCEARYVPALPTAGYMARDAAARLGWTYDGERDLCAAHAHEAAGVLGKNQQEGGTES